MKAVEMSDGHVEKVAERKAQQEALWSALRMLEQNRSVDEVARISGFHRLTLEKALLEAKRRQELIRCHLQDRGTLTSHLSYSDRGPWGQSGYFGNCAGYLLVDLFDYYRPSSVFDPMEGSGTTGEVCFDLGIDYLGWDLQAGQDLLTSPLPDQTFDCIFWHPPYWPGHRYTDHPNDFSGAKHCDDFLTRIQEGLTRLMVCLHPKSHLVLMIGDGRKNGVFFPLHAEIVQWGLLPLEAVLIKDGGHARRARHYRYGPTSFIPTLHEYVLIFKGGN